jgi:hypothetical protein
VPDADTLPLNPPPVAERVRLEDGPVMRLGIPGFGILIPWLTGLYGPLTPREPMFWLGQVLFVALAASIWLGNRWLLLEQRKHWDWFGQPLRKLATMVAANVLYTAPLTVAGLLAWYAASGLPVDWRTLQLVVATNVICVLFVTHAYETLFLIRERESDLMRVERLERARTQAELAALKAQVDPHFLFNSLNTLGHLIEQPQRATAREFCDTLAEVYRYLLDSGRQNLVPLADELAFLRRYHRLLELRFGAALPLVGLAEVEARAVPWRIAPLALQGLLENAVKHNRASVDEPLPLELRLQDGLLQVSNPLRPRRSTLPSAGVGLANLDERCRLLSGRPLERGSAPDRFEVGVPLLPA